MNAPFMPCAGLGDSAPSPESPSSKTRKESGQVVSVHTLGPVVFCHASSVQEPGRIGKGTFQGAEALASDSCTGPLYHMA